MRRPNVLLLYTDQQRWDTLGCAGNDLMHTPNLDALAADGVLLKKAFCNNSVCMPNRQSMLSGQYPSALGCSCNGIEMRADVPTLATVLKPYGYHTANLGKLHFKNHSDRDHREPHPLYGFDTLVVSDEPGCYDDAYVKWVRAQAPGEVERCRCSTPPACTGKPVVKHGRRLIDPYVFEGPEHLTHTAFVADETIRCIQAHKSQPFFAIAGFYAPHPPVNPPARFVEMYDPAEMPLPARNEGENYADVTDEQWRVIKAHYYALVSHVDDQVGRILNTLDEEGLRDDTIVIFTSDHGEHLGDHGLVAKGRHYDSCSRVPLVVRFPGHVAAGTARPEIIEAVDIAPTVLDWCGVQAPPFLQGRTFRPLLDGGDYDGRTSAFIEMRYPFQVSWKAVRTPDFKYCVSSAGREQLSDLRSDPHELHNVAEHDAAKGALHEMRAEMLRRWFEVEKQYPLRTAQY